MPKARVDWAFNEALTSSKHDEQTTDYITPGVPIWNVQGDSIGGAVPAGGIIFAETWYPYNGAKSVYDRLRIIGSYTNTSGLGIGVWEYTIDNGAAWVPVAIAAPPVALTANRAGAAGQTYDHTVNLAGVVGATWLGLRMDNTGAGWLNAGFWFVGLLYLSSDTPF